MRLQRPNELEREKLDTQQQSTCLRFSLNMFVLMDVLRSHFLRCSISSTRLFVWVRTSLRSDARDDEEYSEA